MEDERHSPAPTAPPAPPFEHSTHPSPFPSPLTGHVPQLDLDRSIIIHNDALHQQQANHSRQHPTHPFELNFSFPTLNTDGSIPDLLTAHQSKPYHTPPAALSTLGAKSNMADRDYVSESEHSMSDGQYDMIEFDEVSEASTDEHDTASIASDDAPTNPALFTPEYFSDNARDETERKQEPEFSDTHQAAHHSTDRRTRSATLSPPMAASSVDVTPPASSHGAASSSSASRAQRIRAENDLLDSYMSEDLETPRQSTITSAFPNSRRSTTVKPLVLDGRSTRILFVSSREAAQEDMDTICARIAECMDFKSSANGDHKVIRLPATPSGIAPPSAIVIYGQDDVSATVQHCVGAESRLKGSFSLRVLDYDGEHTSYFTVGADCKIALPQPDIAVYYLEDAANAGEWFCTALKAVQSLDVPSLIICEPYSASNRISILFGECLDAKRTHCIESPKFFRMDQTALTKSIQDLKNDATPKTSDKKFTRRFPHMSRSWKTVSLMLTAILPYLFLSFMSPSWNAAIELPARREALALSLQQAIPDAEHEPFNLTHLVPSLPESCFTSGVYGLQLWAASNSTCIPRSQGTSPNHMVISLPGRRAYPRVVDTSVSRAESRIEFNQTMLLEGVYLITIDPVEAYGSISFNMLTKRPTHQVSATHNYGKRMLQRKTYEKATTDVSKAVGKDVAVMRMAAKSLTEKLSTELSAGMWATRNVTSQVAVYVARELQLYGNTAAAMLEKAVRASDRSASIIGKEVMVVQKGIVALTKQLSTSVKSNIESVKSNSKAIVRSELILARTNLDGFVKAWKDRKAQYEENRRTNLERGIALAEGRYGEISKLKERIEGMGELIKRTTDSAISRRAHKNIEKSKQQLAAVRSGLKAHKEELDKIMTKTQMEPEETDIVHSCF